MKTLFQKEAVNEIIGRINQLTPVTQRQWGRLMYKHIDHHFKQFGV